MPQAATVQKQPTANDIMKRYADAATALVWKPENQKQYEIAQKEAALKATDGMHTIDSTGREHNEAQMKRFRRNATTWTSSS